MVKKSMYHKIKKLQRIGYSKNQTKRELGIDKKTVIKYWSMNEYEYREYASRSQYREKEYDKLKAEILGLYQENDYLRLPVSAVYDYFEEKIGSLPANENSLRNYIRYLEETGQLKLYERTRYYTKVPEMPYGYQQQIDFGEQKSSRGEKFYIFAAVLSASRFKYAALQANPFKTIDLITHLLNCFDYIKGVPQELVIDQDSIMVVEENAGDIIYTGAFGDFAKEMDIKMRVCRKADPESKGKIENFIKYIKYNFFALRDFDNLTEAQESLMRRLERRANGKISQATKKIPLIEIEEERKYLKPLKNSIYRKEYSSVREERIVNDKCRIAVDASQYDLPENYRNKVVEIYKTEERLFVFDRHSGEEICDYALSMIPGIIIRNRSTERQMGIKVQELKAEVMGYFVLENWRVFLEANFSTFSRYVRDQCLEARKYFGNKEVALGSLDQALQYCLTNTTYSIKNLRDSYKYFREESKQRMVDSPVESIVTVQNGRLRITSNVDVSKPDLVPYQSLLDIAGGRQ